MIEKPPTIQPINPETSISNFHRHNGIDSPRIKSNDLLGTPFLFIVNKVADATAAPTTKSTDGTVIIQYDTVPKYYMWVRVAGLWKSTQLT